MSKPLIREIEKREGNEEAERVSRRFLEIANRNTEMIPLLKEFVAEIKDFTRCGAVGIRILDEEGHIPYEAYEGFSRRFYASESPLSIKSDNCMCINVIKGTADPDLPFYTEGGSFYINGTTRFLDTITEEERGETRNVCNESGYESVALIPIRMGDRILGLIHLADGQENMVPLEAVEVLEGVAIQLGTAIQRVRAEEELRRTEREKAAILDNMSELVAYHTPEMKVLWANRATSESFGLSPEELIGRQCYEVFQQRDKPCVGCPVKKSIRTKQPQKMEMISPDGRIWIIKGYPVQDINGDLAGVVEVTEDITERKQAEATLQKRTHDLGERVKELNCLYGISGLVEKPGTSMDEVLQGIVNFIPPGWQYPEITCARVSLEDQAFETNNFMETIWKQTSDIFVNGHRTGTLEVYYLKEKPERDEGPFLEEERNLINAIAERLGKVTERKEAEDALQESEERYRILTEQVADGVTLVQDGRFLFMNRAFISMFGYTDANQLIGKRATDLISGELNRGVKGIYGSIDSDISRKGIFKAQCLTREGREFWVEGHHNVIRWEDQPAVLTTIRDITERRLQEIAIQQEAEHLRRENIRLRSSMKDRHEFENIIGKSPALQEVFELILKTSESNINVVINGESGTGKELVAQSIHDLSRRRGNEFVAVNCGAIPETLLESEFFGYKKGAFTGALMDKHGYLDLADKGTLFLDEITELDLNMQAKLLRAIDGGGYMPVGSSKTKKSDFRIIAATNLDLMDQVNQGLIREDFFYRINVISITVPPLRDRKEDIPLLIEHFLKLLSQREKPTVIPEKIIEAMYNYHWPGNVRELQNVLHRYLTVKRLDFMNPNSWKHKFELNCGSLPEFNQEKVNLSSAVEKLEKNVISKALDQTHWNKSKSAILLGISRRALYRKMKNFEMI